MSLVLCGAYKIMPMIFEDVIARLKLLDEITLMEVLEISSEDLIERFQDKVEIKLEYLTEDLEDEQD
jgi:hypothetical protein